VASKDSTQVRNIILTVGLIASGKSTWSLEEMKRYPGKYKRINQDLMRLMLDGNEWSLKNENFILDMRDRMVEKALVSGYDVLIDDVNFSNKHFTAMCKIAEYIGNVRVMEKLFPISLKEALERNSKREGFARIEDHIVVDMYNKHFKNRKDPARDIYFPKKTIDYSYMTDTSKEHAVIVDIDGTLAHAMSRNVFDVSRVIEDGLCEPVCALTKMFYQRGYKILIVSGREDIARKDTCAWLFKHAVPYHELFMREAGDHRKDFIVKDEIYRSSIEPKYNVHYILDDRPQVVRSWRRNVGRTVLQVNDLDF